MLTRLDSAPLAENRFLIGRLRVKRLPHRAMLSLIFHGLHWHAKSELNWKILFTDIFKQHTREEAEEIFICGTKQTTPAPSSVLSEMPKPWLYSRVFAVFFIAAVFLWICCSVFQNSKTLPGLIMLGSLTVPLSVMIMFWS